MTSSVYLLYLDRYHLDDPLFLQELAQHLASGPAGEPRCLIVHGGGEKAERTLESEGIFVEREGGVLQVEAPEHIRLVERAIREANQNIVGTLTDHVVSSVGLQGVDRSLLRRGANGRVEAGHLGWVQDLVKMRVVPVISALVREEESGLVREVPPDEAMLALAAAFGPEVIPVFFTKNGQPGLRNGEVRAEAGKEALPGEEVLPEPDVVRRSLREGRVMITNLEAFFGGDQPEGTWISAENP